MAKENVYLASKPRFEVLDGLRGVAAMLVLLFHCFETYCPPGGQQVINHGYLAVDFFFALSGFVIGYAYDDRWDRMTTWGFFKRRLVRLHPMVVAGTVVGACLFFLSADAFPQVLQNPFWKVLLCFVMGLLMIPCGTGFDIRGWSEFNSFNGPNWSLTLEYVGNILYALVFRRLPKLAIGALCALSALLTLDLTLGWDMFGLFPAGTGHSVIGGWSLTADQLYIGFSRLLYPFLCGLLISRILSGRMTQDNPSGSPVRMRNGFLVASLILAVIFSVPYIEGGNGLYNGIYQAVCILLVFPVVVLIGAGSRTWSGAGTKVCKWLGDISYPLYITHFPLMYIQMSFAKGHPEAPAWIHVAVSGGVCVLSIILAWCLLKVYDEPVRKWLTDHWMRRKVKADSL